MERRECPIVVRLAEGERIRLGQRRMVATVMATVAGRVMIGIQLRSGVTAAQLQLFFDERLPVVE